MREGGREGGRGRGSACSVCACVRVLCVCVCVRVCGCKHMFFEWEKVDESFVDACNTIVCIQLTTDFIWLNSVDN